MENVEGIQEEPLGEAQERHVEANKQTLSYAGALLGGDDSMIPEVTLLNEEGEDKEEEDGVSEESEDRQMEEDEEDEVRDVNPTQDVRLSVDEHNVWCKLWSHSLIVHLLGRKIGLAYLETRLKKWWEKFGTIQIVDINNDHFIVTFTDEKDYNHAFQEGPWIISDHYLIVQKWRPDFYPEVDTVRKVAVWFRITGLPIEYYNRTFLWGVASSVGCPVKIDKLSFLAARGKFARMCMEVDLRRNLVSQIRVKGRTFSVEYEGLKLICFKCGRYGHGQGTCPTAKGTTGDGEGEQGSKNEGEKAVDPEADIQGSGREHRESNNIRSREGQHDQTGDKGCYGEWMQVKKATKRKPLTARNRDYPQNNKKEHAIGKENQMNGGQVNVNGSRFQVLEETEEATGLNTDNQGAGSGSRNEQENTGSSQQNREPNHGKKKLTGPTNTRPVPSQKKK